MRTVVLAEKPSFGQALLRSIVSQGVLPDEEWYSAGMPPYCVLGRAFDFPQGLPYASFPQVFEPVYKQMGSPGTDFGHLTINGTDHFGPFGWSMIEGSDVIPRRYFGGGWQAFDGIEVIRSADRVLYCFDDNATSRHGSLKVHEWVSGLNPGAEVSWHLFVSLTDAAIHRSLADPVSIEDIKKGAERSEIKRYFDYNFLINRNVIIRRAFDLLGIPSSARLPSKYGFPLLYWLSEQGRGGLSVTDTVDRMKRWEGSGVYRKRATRAVYEDVSLGQPTSYWAIFEDLIAGGLVLRSGQVLSVTDRGRVLLSALHPDCRDLDLPFRIREWEGMTSENAKAKIARYINTWFGKQRRFIEKMR